MRHGYWKGLRYAGLLGVLALLVALATGCSRNATDTTSSTGYPQGRDWEMTGSEDSYLKNYAGGLQWGDYAYLDVTCLVQLLKDRKYGDRELLSIAKKIVEYATHRSITNVFVKFIAAPEHVYGRHKIAQVDWAPPDWWLSGRSDLGDYSRHRYEVSQNDT